MLCPPAKFKLYWADGGMNYSFAAQSKSKSKEQEQEGIGPHLFSPQGI
jgi:hypothetical protein